jgi:three-Cys-motif partner protein
MIQANDYRGREQTYVKHVFLNHYLERVAWVTLANNRGWQEFVYIDGFAGPWRVSSEDSRDTSVSIALRKLTEVKRGLSASGRTVRMRAIFVEHLHVLVPAQEYQRVGFTGSPQQDIRDR